MNAFIKRITYFLLAILMLSTVSIPSSDAYYRTVYRVRPHYYYSERPTVRGWFHQHPKIRAATIGAGIGAIAGGAVGLIRGRHVGRAIASGAGAGAGIGLIRSSNHLKRHPIIQDTLT